VTWAVVGASAGLGRALCERLARDGRALLLVASDPRDLEALACDLRLACGARARVLAHDGADHAGLAEALARALEGEEVEGLLFPIGATADDDEGGLDAARAEQIVRVNLLAVISVVSRFLPAMLARGRGAIVGFGSIAAARGRGRNVVYSASKRALESYFESLRHLCEPRGLCVALYVLGYVDTQLAFGQRLLLPKADPAAVAARVCDELGRRRGRRHLPAFWGPITRLLRALPWPLFRRLRF
jgi:short-subunit dehydrogenase